jgi:hypothetical protein
LVEKPQFLSDLALLLSDQLSALCGAVECSGLVTSAEFRKPLRGLLGIGIESHALVLSLPFLVSQFLLARSALPMLGRVDVSDAQDHSVVIAAIGAHRSQTPFALMLPLHDREFRLADLAGQDFISFSGLHFQAN